MKTFLKLLAVAAAGAGVKAATEALPTIQNTKYGPAVVTGLLLAGAYAAKSPFLQQVMQAAQGQTETPKQDEGK